MGGGGLASGVAAYIKAVRPEIKIIGVEAADAAGMTESLIAGEVVTLPSVGLFADGAAVKTVGSETFRVCHALVDEMITVKTDAICSAIKVCFNDTRCVLEPAGALAIAGMSKYIHDNKCINQTFIAVTSGANMDFDRLRFVSERADSSETLMSITIPEKPGSFLSLYKLLYPRNVTEFSYRYHHHTEGEQTQTDGHGDAHVIASFQALAGTSIEEDKACIQSLLTVNGYTFVDFSDNELAKSHIRHLAGGRTALPVPATNNNKHALRELVYRFEFPESPGALDRFLTTLYHFNPGWSISLFHYRNHGHDYGRVLVGLLVQQDEDEGLLLFHNFLTQLGYTYYEETNNPAYIQFIK